MSNLYFVRGNEVTFEVRFLDANRQPMSPPGATLRVAFKRNGVPQTATLTMASIEQGVFRASWDSSPADPGIIEFHARTSDGKAADDGQFQLVANEANPENS